MPLSAYTDANRFLDQEKLAFTDQNQASGDVKSADRLIKAALFEIFGAVVNTWDINPVPPQVATPEIIVDISGMLTAAYFYSRMYSEETTEIPAYSSSLEARAMALLDKLRAGTLGLDDETYIAGTAWSQDDFWPNDSYVDSCGNPKRFFDVEQVF